MWFRLVNSTDSTVNPKPKTEFKLKYFKNSHSKITENYCTTQTKETNENIWKSFAKFAMKVAEVEGIPIYIFLCIQIAMQLPHEMNINNADGLFQIPFPCAAFALSIATCHLEGEGEGVWEVRGEGQIEIAIHW